MLIPIIVLEHPGGPYMRIPLGGRIFNRLNDSACLIGQTIACCSFFFKSCCPPICSQLTFGISNVISRIALGLIFRIADLMSSMLISPSDADLVSLISLCTHASPDSCTSISRSAPTYPWQF